VTLNVLDLFSGIGGFSLGLERTGGFRTVAFCEIEPFCRRVLAKHWPAIPCYDDVRTLTAARLAADGIAVDVICGGFPCQDISVAGKGAGIAGERSGLWSEYARIIGEVRPRYVIVENVAALLGRGLSRVLGDLAALGFDAEWNCIPASAVGAPHRRERIWILAYPGHETGSAQPWQQQSQRPEISNRSGAQNVADTIGPRLEGRGPISRYLAAELAAIERNGSNVSNTARYRWTPQGERSATGHTDGLCELRPEQGANWLIEPDVGRVAHGVPARVDRLRSLGNAVVPQIPEMIGRAILAARDEVTLPAPPAALKAS